MIAASDPRMKDSLPFTPKKIDPHLCMARVWADGRGLQCSMAKRQGAEFCGRHNTCWEVHGRVDGPIPEKKLKEFQKHQLKISKKVKSGEGKVGDEKKEGKTRKNGRRDSTSSTRDTPEKGTKVASAGERCKKPRVSQKRVSSTNSKSGKPSHTAGSEADVPSSSKVHGKRAAHEAFSDEETTAEADPEKRATRNLKRRRQEPKEKPIKAAKA